MDSAANRWRDAAAWLVTRGIFARTVVIKVRYEDFTTITRSHSVTTPTRDADAIAACEVAAVAFPAWSALSPTERRARLLKAADVMQSKVDEFISAMMAETGATGPWGGFNVMLAAGSSGLRETRGAGKTAESQQKFT